MNETLKRLCGKKKVLILGFGREGKSTWQALKRSGAECEVAIADAADIQPPEQGVKVFSGSEYQQSAKEYDIVFKSPGIVLDRQLENCGCLITCQTNVFMERFGRQTVGITGTKGKSTCTTLLYHILKNSGVKSVMVGNIGIPCFDKADEISPDTTVVFELSCHQLEYADCSPHIGALVNLYEEHLDHYGTAERYFAAKKNIYRFQRSQDTLFCSVQCAGMLENVVSRLVTVSGDGSPADIREVCGKVFHSAGEYAIPVDEIHLLGEHNRFNIAMVYGIAKEFGVKDDDFTAALKTYLPPAHRLEFCGRFGGVDYYDDSISTISQTCINAVNSVPNISTLIVGGMDRGIDYGSLESFLAEKKDLTVIFIAASGKRIIEEMQSAGTLRQGLYFQEGLEQAVALAKKLTPRGKAVVLSPAAASYGYYKNFEERGEHFKQLICVG